MIALDPDIIIEFNTTLARAKLEALNILRALITKSPDNATSPTTPQRLAAAQILRTTFISHPARTSTSGAETARDQTSPSPSGGWQGAGGSDTLGAQSGAQAPPTPTIQPNDIDELAQLLTPEQFLDLIESLPGGTVLGDSPEEQARINASILEVLDTAREQPRGPPRPR